MLLLANFFGWIYSHWRVLVLCLGALALLIVIVLINKACSRHRLKVTNEQVEKINKANEQERKQELEKVVTENSDVIKTVDNRTELTNADIYERQRAAQARIAEADRKIAEAKAQGHDVTGPELECMLTGNCEQ